MKNMTTIPSIIFFIQNKKGYFLPEQKRHEMKNLTIPKNIHKKKPHQIDKVKNIVFRNFVKIKRSSYFTLCKSKSSKSKLKSVTSEIGFIFADCALPFSSIEKITKASAS